MTKQTKIVVIGSLRVKALGKVLFSTPYKIDSCFFVFFSPTKHKLLALELPHHKGCCHEYMQHLVGEIITLIFYMSNHLQPGSIQVSRFLVLSILGKNSSRQHFEIFFLYFLKKRICHFLQIVS